MRESLWRVAPVACALFFAAPAGAQPPSEMICTSATRYLAVNQLPIKNGMMLTTSDYRNSASWQAAAAPTLGTLVDTNSPQIKVSGEVGQIYLAYFMARYFPSTGAVSAKVSVVDDAKNPTNYVDVYRPPIARGEDRCEPRGRAQIERRVRVNEYIDYHDPAAGGLSSTLEDFHFSYPVDETHCRRTNDQSTVAAFQFDGVTRTKNDSYIARIFPIVGTAYAVTHNFAILRSELHYRANVDSAGTCIGFVVPLSRYKQANFVVNEIGYGSMPVPEGWLISR